jgi:hypothetical protein
MLDELEASEPREINESRVRLGIVIVCGIVLTLSALFTTGIVISLTLGLIGRPPNDARGSISVVLMGLIGVFGIVAFGWTTVKTVRRLLGPRDPVVFLTDHGVKDVRISSEWIPWSAIQSVENFRGSSVRLGVDPQFLKTFKLDPSVRLWSSANRLLGFRGLYIAAFPLENISTRKLVDIVSSRIGVVDHSRV